MNNKNLYNWTYRIKVKLSDFEKMVEKANNKKELIK